MKTKPIFTMLIGLPASGKSTWAEKRKDTYQIHSSDKIREELFGNEDYECTPEQNNIVFTVLHQRVKNDLKMGRNVIYDATNISKKRRISFLKELRKISCVKRCVLFATDYEVCIKQNQGRSRKVPEEVIRKMYTTFQPPHKTEGWNNISIVYNVDFSKYPADKADAVTKDFDQGNSHHTLTLDKHMIQAGVYVKERTADQNVKIAALFHDIGKLTTKSQGEDGECHYYNHHCAGAYDAIFYLTGSFLDLNKTKKNSLKYMNDSILEISNLIYYHMHPFLSWKESQKAREKDKKLLGEEMFNKIMLIHEADLAAH